MIESAPKDLAVRDRPWLSIVDRMHRAVAGVEAWVGAFYTTFFVLLIGFPVIAGAVVSPFEDEFGPEWAAAMLIAAALWFMLDVPFAFRTWQRVRSGDRPLAPAVARGLVPWPGVLRLVQGTWFLSHFAVGAFFAHVTIELAPPAMQEQRATAYTLFTAMLAFFYTLAANGFLLAAVKTLSARDSWVDFTWRWRIVVDIALVVIAMLWTSLETRPL